MMSPEFFSIFFSSKKKLFHDGPGPSQGGPRAAPVVPCLRPSGGDTQSTGSHWQRANLCNAILTPRWSHIWIPFRSSTKILFACLGIFRSFRKAHLLPKKPFEMVFSVLPNHSCRFPICFFSLTVGWFPELFGRFALYVADIKRWKPRSDSLLQLLDLSAELLAMAPKVPPLARLPQGSAEASTRGASDLDIWVFPKIRVHPQIIHFNRVFHYKPSILGYPYFRKHPYHDIYDISYPWRVLQFAWHSGDFVMRQAE